MFLLTIMLKQYKMEGWDIKPTRIRNFQNSRHLCSPNTFPSAHTIIYLIRHFVQAPVSFISQTSLRENILLPLFSQKIFLPTLFLALSSV